LGDVNPCDSIFSPARPLPSQSDTKPIGNVLNSYNGSTQMLDMREKCGEDRRLRVRHKRASLRPRGDRSPQLIAASRWGPLMHLLLSLTATYKVGSRFPHVRVISVLGTVGGGARIRSIPIRCPGSDLHICRGNQYLHFVGHSSNSKHRGSGSDQHPHSNYDQSIGKVKLQLYHQ